MLLKNNLEGLQHLAIFVSDLDRSRAFYEKLGFIEKLREDIASDPEPIKLSFVELNGLTLELVELSGEDRAKVAARGDGHIDHVALNVKDIDKAYAEMTAAGFPALEENAPVLLHIWQNGTKYFTVHGPDGENVEFNQIL